MRTGRMALVGVGLMLALGLAMPAAAQDFPVRPLRMLIGFGPGGATDAVARIVAQRLGERLGQPVVPDVRLGATGTIAADVVAKAPPDGHSLILLTGAHSTAGAFLRSLPFDPVDGFTMVSTVVTYPMVISTAAASPIRDMGDVVARARARPNSVSYGTAGLGSLMHLVGESIGSEAGVELLHVPFKGGAPALIDVLNGRVDLMVDTLTNSYGQITGGALRALVVTTPERSRFLPDVPVLGSVLPGLAFVSWNGVATAPGTPAPIVDRLNREIRAVLAEPETIRRLADLAGEATASSPAEMRERVAGEVAQWRRVIERRGIERQ